MRGESTSRAGEAAQRLHAAHKALRAEGDVQFALPPVKPPAPTPEWLKALGRWLEDLFRPVGRAFRWLSSWMPDAPYARIVLWTAIVLAVGFMLWAAAERLRHGEWRLPRRRRRTAAMVAAAEEESWTPDAAPVRAWLREADALAAQGRYAEAAHCLLFRSVEDIARRRPRLVRPALTAREIAGAEAIPVGARSLFADIAALVERSLFGGRAVAHDDWTTARAAYAELVLPGSWHG